MIHIVEAVTPKQHRDFVMFPFDLFKGNNSWVPPIINEELETFNPKKNPAFKTAECHLFLAYNDNKIVGRLAAIVNWDEVNILKKNKVRFGWFDVIDDIEVTKTLLNKAIEFGKSKGMDHIEGPVGFSNLDKVGVLTEGFEYISTMISWYSMPYYKTHFEKLGYTVEKKFIESIFPFENVNGENFERLSKLIKTKYQLHSKNFTSTKEIMPHVDQMFELFNTSYAKLQSFVPISQHQIDYFKKKYISFINPEYIKFVFDKDNQLVAFSIVMPGFAEALQKTKGKLFPFGFLHMLNAKRHSKEVVFYLIGILPEYQSKGVTAIIFDDYFRVFKKKGIKTCIRTPELEENNAIHNLWKNFNPVIHKRRCTYTKPI